MTMAQLSGRSVSWLQELANNHQIQSLRNSFSKHSFSELPYRFASVELTTSDGTNAAVEV